MRAMAVSRADTFQIPDQGQIRIVVLSRVRRGTLQMVSRMRWKKAGFPCSKRSSSRFWHFHAGFDRRIQKNHMIRTRHPEPGFPEFYLLRRHAAPPPMAGGIKTVTRIHLPCSSAGRIRLSDAEPAANISSNSVISTVHPGRQQQFPDLLRHRCPARFPVLSTSSPDRTRPDRPLPLVDLPTLRSLKGDKTTALCHHCPPSSLPSFSGAG